ncbi:dual specificity protein phosphatase 14-like [Rhinatrema bivittatum]|uniref:dual specificity protein phosphatase 14-like n=1 Tax=Rhinatrema bivittatum TaxID=194408 RepID=UPI00112D00CD|nr:dual specificity protein phosphatase 14-like [Rhinatrema bivittatum]XP_029430999.1 dual specificity protein phosphatase 14-like [Rhinatrema bivittatum]XP_029431000.1 dual specificity protein phosphatase 14-like [Rhinatrema bivittatum]XP_029431001.1 dual specificity protein phosphatase 14-like [Rhinatrema bivittatum]
MRHSSIFPRTTYSVSPPRQLLPGTMAVLSGVDQITPSLYLSNATSARNRSILSAKRITCIVNATMDVQRPTWPGVDYVRVPVADLPHARLSDYFDTVADRIRLVERHSGRTLVHCVAGVSRSATLCIAYLMKYEGLSLREAYSWVKSRRPMICPNAGFWHQLMVYEKRLFGKSSVKMEGPAETGRCRRYHGWMAW